MKTCKKGFTIIETMLALTFLAILMVSISTLIIRITNIYQKGLALRAINSTGTEIIDDITRTLNSASYITDLYLDDGQDRDAIMSYENNYKSIDKYYYAYTTYGEESYGESMVNVQYFGVFCTGTYSYIWNTARALDENRANSRYVEVNGKKVKMVRVLDRGQTQCDAGFEGDDPGHTDGSVVYQATSGTLPVKITIDSEDVVELINDDESDLALYEFNLVPATQSTFTRQSYISANFILATREGGININANGDYCRGDGNEFSDEYEDSMFDYCAVNKFTFSSRTGGNSDKEG